MRNLTAQEKALLDALGDVWNMLSDLPKIHPSDTPESMFHIHALQKSVASRPVIEFMRGD